jgi:hypothetical protein
MIYRDTPAVFRVCEFCGELVNQDEYAMHERMCELVEWLFGYQPDAPKRKRQKRTIH